MAGSFNCQGRVGSGVAKRPGVSSRNAAMPAPQLRQPLRRGPLRGQNGDRVSCLDRCSFPLGAGARQAANRLQPPVSADSQSRPWRPATIARHGAHRQGKGGRRGMPPFPGDAGDPAPGSTQTTTTTPVFARLPYPSGQKQLKDTGVPQQVQDEAGRR